MLEQVGASGVDFFQSLGDLSYDTIPPAAWCQMVKDSLNRGAQQPLGAVFGERFPFEIIVGNHDAATLDEYTGPACLPDRLGAQSASGTSYGRQYYYDYPVASPLVRFIMTAPGVGLSYAPGSPDRQWLIDAIDSARSSGTKWIIVGNHMNYISMGQKANEIGSDYFDLLVSKRVDLIVQGHDHTYQRSKQLALGPDCPTVQTGAADLDCVVDDGSDGTVEAGRGPVLLINGTGGVGHYALNAADGEAPYFARAMGANSPDRAFGFSKVVVSDTELVASFVAGAGGPYSDTLRIAAGTPDTSAPSVVSGVSGAAVSPSGIALQWAPATDDRGVVGYRVTRDGVVVAASVAQTQFSDSGLQPATSYVYTVQALDAAGNVGPPSDPVTVTTSPADTALYRESWSGSDGSPWPTAWTTSVSSPSAGTVETRAGEGRLRVADVSGAYGRGVLSGAPAQVDGDLLTSFRWGSRGAASYLTVVLRGSGGWQNASLPRNSYGVQLASSGSTVVVLKSVAGVVTTLKNVSAGQSDTTAKQWLRLRAVGSQIMFRTWLDGTPEPSTWKWSGTDTAVTTPGQPHVSLSRSSTNVGPKDLYLDDLALFGSAPAPDTSAPSVVSGVSGAAVSPSGIALQWAPATDDRGVVGYRVTRDGVVVAASVAQTQFSDSGLQPATSYVYTVQALDAAGNVGPPSDPVTVTTSPADTALYRESWSGSDGSPWPTAWTTSVSSPSAGTVETRAGEGRLRVGDVSGAYGRGVLSGAPAQVDGDLLTSFRWGSRGAASYLTVVLRGSGGWQNASLPRNSYGVQLASSGSTVVVLKSVAGVVTTLKNVSAGQSDTTAKQWLRLRAVGSQIMFRTWLDGTPEPSTWKWSGTDTAVTTPGQPHVSLSRSSTNVGPKDLYLDDLSWNR